ncbi:MAG: hypothetical protein Q9162_005140 [Coniocarpon cinnabarinum]
MGLPILSVPVYLTLLIACYSLWNLYQRITRSYLERQHACSAPRSADERSYLFGFDHAIDFLVAAKQNRNNASTREKIIKYGNTFQMSALRGGRKVISIEPQNLKAVFASDFPSWGLQQMRLFPFEPFIGPGIMVTDGDLWKVSRGLIQPAFARAQIADFSRLDGHVERLLRKIPSDGSTIDLQPLFALFGLDTSTDFLFGESVGCLEEQECGDKTPKRQDFDAQAFISACNHCQVVIGKRMQLPHWNVFTRDRNFWKSCQRAKQFVESHVNRIYAQDHTQAEKGLSKPSRFILANELAKETTDRNLVRDQLLNVFMPARDASAVTLTNVFFQLARHPAIWSKLRDEILSSNAALSAGKDPDGVFAGLKSLKYLQHVIQETLRLHPPIGLVTRVAVRDTVLPIGGGKDGLQRILMRKGDVFQVSYYALHRSKEVYGEDADDFRPERWTQLRPPHWAFAPFSGGPRHCPGQQIALAEISYAMVKFLKAFKHIENRDPVLAFVENYKITTDSANGAKVAFTA